MCDRSADESPTSVGTPAFGVQGPRTSPSAWLADALQALAELDDEIAEDGLPEIGPSVRKEAERIIVGLARHPWAPTVYPTQDAEVAIHFKSPDSPGSVLVLLDNHGRGECYAYIGGHSRRARYGGFVGTCPTVSSWSSWRPWCRRGWRFRRRGGTLPAKPGDPHRREVDVGHGVCVEATGGPAELSRRRHWRRCTTRPTRSCSPFRAWSKTCCAALSPVYGWTTSTSRRSRSCRPSTSATSCSGGTAMPCGGSGCAGVGCTWWCCSNSSRWDEPRMALRILTYTGLLYEELVRNGEVASGEPLAARAAGGPVQRRAALAGGSGDERVDRCRGAGTGAVSAGATVPRG